MSPLGETPAGILDPDSTVTSQRDRCRRGMASQRAFITERTLQPQESQRGNPPAIGGPYVELGSRAYRIEIGYCLDHPRVRAATHKTTCLIALDMLTYSATLPTALLPRLSQPSQQPQDGSNP